jgi:hypothetical protein
LVKSVITASCLQLSFQGNSGQAQPLTFLANVKAGGAQGKFEFIPKLTNANTRSGNKRSNKH